MFPVAQFLSRKVKMSLLEEFEENHLVLEETLSLELPILLNHENQRKIQNLSMTFISLLKRLILSQQLNDNEDKMKLNNCFNQLSKMVITCNHKVNGQHDKGNSRLKQVLSILNCYLILNRYHLNDEQNWMKQIELEWKDEDEFYKIFPQLCIFMALNEKVFLDNHQIIEIISKNVIKYFTNSIDDILRRKEDAYMEMEFDLLMKYSELIYATKSYGYFKEINGIILQSLTIKKEAIRDKIARAFCNLYLSEGHGRKDEMISQLKSQENNSTIVSIYLIVLLMIQEEKKLTEIEFLSIMKLIDVHVENVPSKLFANVKLCEDRTLANYASRLLKTFLLWWNGFDEDKYEIILVKTFDALIDIYQFLYQSTNVKMKGIEEKRMRSLTHFFLPKLVPVFDKQFASFVHRIRNYENCYEMFLTSLHSIWKDKNCIKTIEKNWHLIEEQRYSPNLNVRLLFFQFFCERNETIRIVEFLQDPFSSFCLLKSNYRIQMFNSLSQYLLRQSKISGNLLTVLTNYLHPKSSFPYLQLSLSVFRFLCENRLMDCIEGDFNEAVLLNYLKEYSIFQTYQQLQEDSIKIMSFYSTTISTRNHINYNAHSIHNLKSLLDIPKPKEQEIVVVLTEVMSEFGSNNFEELFQFFLQEFIDRCQSIEKDIKEIMRSKSILGCSSTIVKYFLREDNIEKVKKFSDFQSEYLEKLIDTCFITTNLLIPLVCNVAPEGGCIEIGMDLKIDGGQLLLVNCWRGMKDLGKLMEILTMRFPSILGTDRIKEIGDHFIMLLSQTRHKGCIELLSESFLNICKILIRFQDKNECEILFGKWFENVLDLMKKSSASSATRRSAGFPFIILSLLKAESEFHSTQIFCHTKKLLMEIQTISDAEEQNRLFIIHLLNIGSIYLNSSSLQDQHSPEFIDRMILISLDFINHFDFRLANAASQLFRSTYRRLFGEERHRENFINNKTIDSNEDIFNNNLMDDIPSLNNCIDFHTFIRKHQIIMNRIMERLSDENEHRSNYQRDLFYLLLICERIFFWKKPEENNEKVERKEKDNDDKIELNVEVKENDDDVLLNEMDKTKKLEEYIRNLSKFMKHENYFIRITTTRALLNLLSICESCEHYNYLEGIMTQYRNDQCNLNLLHSTLHMINIVHIRMEGRNRSYDQSSHSFRKFTKELFGDINQVLKSMRNSEDFSSSSSSTTTASTIPLIRKYITKCKLDAPTQLENFLQASPSKRTALQYEKFLHNYSSYSSLMNGILPSTIHHSIQTSSSSRSSKENNITSLNLMNNHELYEKKLCNRIIVLYPYIDDRNLCEKLLKKLFYNDNFHFISETLLESTLKLMNSSPSNSSSRNHCHLILVEAILKHISISQSLKELCIFNLFHLFRSNEIEDVEIGLRCLSHLQNHDTESLCLTNQSITFSNFANEYCWKFNFDKGFLEESDNLLLPSNIEHVFHKQEYVMNQYEICFRKEVLRERSILPSFNDMRMESP
ncbi:hypothetical protein SNEBB_005111 [Seison nebaliae]|nr:hypothetical protein SNEBB_005111 [Seison nebaliae]